MASRESSLLFRLERGPGIALQAMQEKTQKSPDTPGSPEGNTEGGSPGDLGSLGLNTNLLGKGGRVAGLRVSGRERQGRGTGYQRPPRFGVSVWFCTLVSEPP